MLQSKHIIRASFIGLFLAILSSIMFYRYFTLKDIVLASVIKENNNIYQQFQEGLQKYPGAVDMLNSHKTLVDLMHKEEFRDFAQETVNIFTRANRIKISIITSNNTEIISTNNVTISSESDNFLDYFSNFFLNLLGELDVSQQLEYGNLVNNIILHPIAAMPNITAYVESYYPIAADNLSGDSGAAYLKIISDISSDWRRIGFFEKRVSILLLAVFAAFFGVIIFNTHHAQRIIDQQVQIHKFLEEAKIKAELESSAKTQFLANVSHELRTPLHAIIGFSEVMLREAYGKLQPAQYQEYIVDINNSGKHLLSVINDILDFSSASADKMKVDMMDVDLGKLASSSLRFVTPRANEANIKLIEKVPEEHVIIQADPKRLKQALLNLLSNAVKFTGANGHVILEIFRVVQDGLVKIRVIDNGIGMEEKDIPKALSSFGQVDNKLSRKFEGTGLGLPLTKKLIELMGGEFEIKSAPKVGTTVTLTFKEGVI
ncbi:MAG: HAMP domain-containing sensor histidine kinase [Rickettsiaceae bacterium]|nr:HAMP domain-containing sensor histidine kinase [Rickettsiaceae bacterium]